MTREEAINKVRQMSLPKETMDILEALAPELKESEDERIRKDIVDLIEFALTDGSAVSPGSHTTKEEALAYLERQKEQKPIWKPSEEHLSALLAIFNDPNNIGSQTCQLALTDLYEQLKKLM